MKYIHQLKKWPIFTWSQDVTPLLAATRHKQGRLSGKMESLGFRQKDEANLLMLTQDVLKSSEIEGERLNKEQVRSSVARRLGLEIGGLLPSDRNVDGVVEMMLDATQNFDKPLTETRLFSWHSSLFPTGRSGMSTITVGKWRTDKKGPMQVISGPFGKERVHFEAPPPVRLKVEMQAFLKWLNKGLRLDPVLKAAIAHLWFITIHPFDDGNGRIARAITDMNLARSDKSARRFYSMSSQIQIERNRYYDLLEATQKGDLDITDWLVWFLECLGRAFDNAESILASVLAKQKFWEKNASVGISERQKKMILKLFDGFEGKLTSSKWATLAKCSQDTAHRDIEDLIEKGILKKEPGGGRSTSYSLLLPK